MKVGMGTWQGSADFLTTTKTTWIKTRIKNTFYIFQFCQKYLIVQVWMLMNILKLSLFFYSIWFVIVYGYVKKRTVSRETVWFWFRFDLWTKFRDGFRYTCQLILRKVHHSILYWLDFDNFEKGFIHNCAPLIWNA